MATSATTPDHVPPSPTSAVGAISMEEAPFNRFHRYISACAAGGPICDGYILGIVAIALGQMTTDLHLSATWVGLIAASSLVGLFLGGLVFGWLTDIVGRRIMYTIDLALFVVCSVLQFWANDAWQVFALRLLLGIAVGADYPIATAMLAEFLPRRQRGSMLGMLVATWWVGYVGAFVAGYFFSGMGAGSWRWALASSAVPAVVVLLLRMGTPESPMWLAHKGRRKEAQAIVTRHIGEGYTLPDELDFSSGRRNSYRDIFGGKYLRRVVFVSIFWSAQIAPTFAISSFEPRILKNLGITDGNLGTMVISLCFLLGAVPAIWAINSWGRRPLLLWGFVFQGLPLLILAAIVQPPIWVTFACFVVFAIANAGASDLQWVYPNELFPTHVRATAVGFTAAMSRVAAAIFTFGLPLAISAWGLRASLLIIVGLTVVGLVVSYALAPETNGLTLREASVD